MWAPSHLPPTPDQKTLHISKVPGFNEPHRPRSAHCSPFTSTPDGKINNSIVTVPQNRSESWRERERDINCIVLHYIRTNLISIVDSLKSVDRDIFYAPISILWSALSVTINNYSIFILTRKREIISTPLHQLPKSTPKLFKCVYL